MLYDILVYAALVENLLTVGNILTISSLNMKILGINRLAFVIISENTYSFSVKFRVYWYHCSGTEYLSWEKICRYNSRFKQSDTIKYKCSDGTVPAPRRCKKGMVYIINKLHCFKRGLLKIGYHTLLKYLEKNLKSGTDFSIKK